MLLETANMWCKRVQDPTHPTNPPDPRDHQTHGLTRPTGQPTRWTGPINLECQNCYHSRHSRHCHRPSALGMSDPVIESQDILKTQWWETVRKIVWELYHDECAAQICRSRWGHSKLYKSAFIGYYKLECNLKMTLSKTVQKLSDKNYVFILAINMWARGREALWSDLAKFPRHCSLRAGCLTLANVLLRRRFWCFNHFVWIRSVLEVKYGPTFGLQES